MPNEPSHRRWQATAMRVLLTPSPMHDYLRLLDILTCVIVMFLGLGVRVLWDSNWALMSFPLAVVAGRWTRRHVPDFEIANGQVKVDDASAD